jgi:hypothetical protein
VCRSWGGFENPLYGALEASQPVFVDRIAGQHVETQNLVLQVSSKCPRQQGDHIGEENPWEARGKLCAVFDQGRLELWSRGKRTPGDIDASSERAPYKEGEEPKQREYAEMHRFMQTQTEEQRDRHRDRAKTQGVAVSFRDCQPAQCKQNRAERHRTTLQGATVRFHIARLSESSLQHTLQALKRSKITSPRPAVSRLPVDQGVKEAIDRLGSPLFHR